MARSILHHDNETKGPTGTVDLVVIGAGVSGIATAKCAREAGMSVVVVERSDAVGGLWHYRDRGYGVMKCTR